MTAHALGQHQLVGCKYNQGRLVEQKGGRSILVLQYTQVCKTRLSPRGPILHNNPLMSESLSYLEAPEDAWTTLGGVS